MFYSIISFNVPYFLPITTWRKSLKQRMVKMPKIGPRFINDFLLPSLNSCKYGERMKWLIPVEKVFLIKWAHKKNSEWSAADAQMYQEWDEMKERASKNLIESKQRFRALLYKLCKNGDLMEIKSPKTEKIFQICDQGLKKKKKKSKQNQVLCDETISNAAISSIDAENLKSLDVQDNEQNMLFSNVQQLPEDVFQRLSMAFFNSESDIIHSTQLNSEDSVQNIMENSRDNYYALNLMQINERVDLQYDLPISMETTLNNASISYSMDMQINENDLIELDLIEGLELKMPDIDSSLQDYARNSG